jgi:hypothetical protein
VPSNFTTNPSRMLQGRALVAGHTCSGRSGAACRKATVLLTAQPSRSGKAPASSRLPSNARAFINREGPATLCQPTSALG